MMKQEFEMSEEQVQAIYDISKDRTPVIRIGVTWLGLDKQERANKLWRTMADEMGFVWDSVEPSARGNKYFLATPKPKVIPKTRAEIEMDKYDSLKKIVEQLEGCKYECEGGSLKTNTAFLKLKQLAESEN